MARRCALTPAQAVAQGRRLIAERRRAEAASGPSEAISDIEAATPRPKGSAPSAVEASGKVGRTVRAGVGSLRREGRPSPIDWSHPTIEASIRQRWLDERLSAAAIAKAMSEELGLPVTRYSVKGKIARMGLAGQGGVQTEPSPSAGMGDLPPPRVEAATTPPATGSENQRDLSTRRGPQTDDPALRRIRANAGGKQARAVAPGGGETALGAPIAEQDQRVEVVANSAAVHGEIAEKYSDPIPSPPQPEPTLTFGLTIVAAEVNTHPDGAWPIGHLGPSQCRFACTDDRAPPDQHRFCGRPTRVQRGNLHGSWCDAHIARVWGTGSVSEQHAHKPTRRMFG